LWSSGIRENNSESKQGNEEYNKHETAECSANMLLENERGRRPDGNVKLLPQTGATIAEWSSASKQRRPPCESLSERIGGLTPGLNRTQQLTTVLKVE